MGFTKIILKDLSRLGTISNYNSLTENWNLMWMYGKHLTLINIPNWSGFMDRITHNLPYEKSQVLFLPFVYQSPSNYNTIYSVLELIDISEFNQKSCFVTFDQPLYIKARDIVASSEQNTNISNITVHFGGFYLLMSFLGCIGFLMAGSGLKDLLSTIYAPVSVDKMLTGHAYSRSFRGHVLVQLVLCKLIFKELNLNTEDYHNIENSLNNFQNDPPKYGQTVVDMTILHTRFNDYLRNLEKRGPTSKLWVKYFNMVTLVKHFVMAKRIGDWKLHLQSVQKMIPYFHASGHFTYAKASHIYFQDMYKLESKMGTVRISKIHK